MAKIQIKIPDDCWEDMLLSQFCPSIPFTMDLQEMRERVLHRDRGKKLIEVAAKIPLLALIRSFPIGSKVTTLTLELK